MAVNKVVYNGNTLVDLTSDTVAADKMLSGYTAHDKSGAAISGSMANNGAMNKTMDGVNTKSVSVPAGYTSGGTVSMDSTIDDAVTAAITALTDKGVTVPDGTNVTELADLIAAIESGGAQIETGTYTFASANSSGLTIDHSLNDIPTFFVAYCTPVAAYDDANYKVASALYYDAPKASGTYSNFVRKYSSSWYAFKDTVSVSSSSIVITLSNSAVFVAGTTLHWIAGCI